MLTSWPSWVNADKSTSWAKQETWSFINFLYVVPFVTQDDTIFFYKTFFHICFFSIHFLHFYKLSFINTFLPHDNPILLWSIFFMFNYIFFASFLLKKFRMTFPLFPFTFRQWRDSMFSVTTKRSTNFKCTFLDIIRSDSILVNLVFSSSNSAFKELRELANWCSHFVITPFTNFYGFLNLWQTHLFL